MKNHAKHMESLAEQLDDRLHRARKLVQHGKDCLRWENTPFKERYLKSNVNIGIRCVDFGPPYYGAIFECPSHIGAPPEAPVNVLEDISTRYGVHGEEPFVLPHYVECVKVEQMRVTSRPRLQLFNDLSVGIGKQMYVFLSPLLRVKENSSGAVDGKLSVFWVREPCALGENIDQHIQAAAEAMNDQPSLNIREGWQRSDIREFVELMTTLRIWIGDDFIRGECSPRMDARFQTFELGMGPLNPGLSV